MLAHLHPKTAPGSNKPGRNKARVQLAREISLGMVAYVRKRSARVGHPRRAFLIRLICSVEGCTSGGYVRSLADGIGQNLAGGL